MKIRICLILTCGLITVTACNNSSKVNGDIIVLNGIEAVKNPKELKLSDIAESIEYVKLETSPECLFSEGSFVVGKKYIVCFNRKPGNVLIFTRGGKFLRTVGSKGKGPQEVEFPTNVDLSLDEERVLVESQERNKLRLRIGIQFYNGRSLVNEFVLVIIRMRIT
jgi:hypothetical protein